MGTENMTPRERILAVLNHQKPDRVPWFGDLDYWAEALITKGQKDKFFKQSQDYVRWHEDLGVGFYLQGYFPFSFHYENCKIENSCENDFRIRSIQTPKGQLREVWKYIPDSYTIGPVEHLIKSERDLPAYRYLYEHTFYRPDYSFANQRLNQIGDSGLLLCYLPKSPFMQLAALDAGIMAIMEIFMNAPDELDETIQVIQANHNAAAKIALNCPAEALMIPENLSSEVVGPLFFEKYMKSYQSEWVNQINKAGKYSFIHMDGTLKGLLKQECAIGFTVIEAMTPAPVGDLAIEDWRKFSEKSNTILWGGIPGSYFTNIVDDEEFDAHVIRVLDVMTTEPKYVLGVADQVPPDTLEYRVRRVSDLVERYGVYK